MGTESASLIPPWPLATAFLFACVVLAVTPGPGVLYIVARSVIQGTRGGLASVAGVALGNLGNAIAACLGLAVLFAASPLAFSVVKYAGAAYLIYLGIQMIRQRDASKSVSVDEAPLRRVFRDGFVVALFNPKTTIFFAAFLPQFLTPGAPPIVQSLLLGTVFVLIAAVSDSAYALLASAVTSKLGHSEGFRRAGVWLGAAIYIGLGIVTALTGVRSQV
jgi:threonine/homoserine/homoserine lactone efflux protein